MNADVIEMAVRKPRTKPAVKPRTESKINPRLLARQERRIKLQHWSAVLLGTVASAMTIVSLSHIAGGVGHLTHGAVPEWQAWGVAIGLDINYVGMEMAGVVAAVAHVPRASPWASCCLRSCSSPSGSLLCWPTCNHPTLIWSGTPAALAILNTSLRGSYD